MTDDETDMDDLGEPIGELAELSHEVSDGFPDRVRRAIDRRNLSGGFLVMAWVLPATLLLEMLTLIFGFFRDDSADKGGSS